MAKPGLDGNIRYVIAEPGDTLSDIAVGFGDGYHDIGRIAAINDIQNPDLIYVGQRIDLDVGASSTDSETASNKPTIKQFGLQTNADNTLFATWDWERSNTESYKVLWTYDTGDGVWFTGSNATNTVDKDAPEAARQSTYSIPANAKKVRFKVKPISEKKTQNDSETSYWEAQWSDVKTYTDSTPIATPATPSVEIDKYKLTATLDNIEADATHIEFEIIKDNTATPFNYGKAEIVTKHASYSCSVDAGGLYKVRCRARKGSDFSDWSAYSNNEGTMPGAVSGITSIRAIKETVVYLEWEPSNTAKTYEIEFATELRYFEGSDATTSKTGIETTHFEITGLETGDEYFFSVRAVNDAGTSPWCEPKSVVIGTKPAAPTTWSSTTTAITGEELNLYWVHNSADGSSQTFAELELNINEKIFTYTIENNRSEEEKDKTSVYPIDTTEYPEGTKILWRVRTAGVTKVYSEFSVQRTIDIYAPPTLAIGLANRDSQIITGVTEFPFYIAGMAGPNTQAPTSYHVTIAANESYETVDNIGNPKTVNAGDVLYSKHFDISTHLLVELSAGDIDLENNATYTLMCVVAMNSGLTAEASLEFGVTWNEQFYEPNAEISINEDTYAASIRPYCVMHEVHRHIVDTFGDEYTVTDEIVKSAYGTPVSKKKTSTGEQVYSGVNALGEEIYFCKVETMTPITDVLLSVYRREFDGTFTELAKDLDGGRPTTIVDPHPSLDFARYRIVATSRATGAVCFYDPPGYPVGGDAVIIQWDERWSSFETSEESGLEQPPWSGSMLKLPYNVDISDSSQPDVSLVEYIGRQPPVASYGTQRGNASTWNMGIEKSDKETLYALRRLANWMGNVYVREPSGSGYWANIKVSMNQKHKDLVIPVTLNVTRVEGGA